jgi:putative ABC transport system permease protein
VTGRLLLVGRLALRDLRRHWTESLLLLLAITAATATLTLGLALNAIAADPYQQTRAATAGPDLVLEPGSNGTEALTALEPLATAPGVTGHSGPFPLAFRTATTNGLNVRVVLEGRDDTPAAVDRPAVTDGTWVRPGGAVLERTFAGEVGVHVGDTITVGDHPLRVTGLAVTAARAVYPWVGWHLPNNILHESGGLIWVHHDDITTLADGQPLSYRLNLKLADPDGGDAFLDDEARHPLFRGWHVSSWQLIAESDARQTAAAQHTLTIGSWLLTVIAIAGVAGIVAGRIAGQRRRVGLLKAVGAGPAVVAAVHLAEYLIVGLAAAALGSAAGWLAAPPLFRPGAGLIGSIGEHPPPGAVLAAAALALTIAAVAALAPVIRATTTSTVHALADSAAPPRRRAWRIRLSRRLPIALLIGVRINARRPRRARLVTVNTLITMMAITAVLMAESLHPQGIHVGTTELPDRRDERTMHAILLVGAMICVLALLNTIVSTSTAVLDARQPLAVARALGATPGQAAAGLAVAQLLPALLGVALGLPFGIWLFIASNNGPPRYAPASWMLAGALTVLLGVAALTAVPALTIARRPIADSLGAV